MSQIQTTIAAKEMELRSLIGDLIYGSENESISEVVGNLLIAKGQTLSIAESCTGGHIGHLITSVPGSSKYFEGGIITYSNQVKINNLGVNSALIEKYGVVSKEVAAAMADQIKQEFNTTFGIGVSGVAGPLGGTSSTPLGTVCIAISGPYGTKSYTEVLGRSRERTIQVASLYALNYLRKEILRTDAC